MLKKIIIATRASKLALWQANFIKNKISEKFPNLIIELNKIISKGDKILDRPLSQVGGKGHFTKELETEILLGNADLAVHSLKDIPSYIPDGLELAAITKREDQRDIFLSNKFKSIEDLPKNAIIGTTSLRRRMQLLKIRPDLKMQDLRGNINSRLEKLKNGNYDGIILAYIGVKRLQLIENISFSQKLPLDILIPPMGQASLGIEIRSADIKIRNIIDFLNDKDTFLCSKLERDFISKIEANCYAPVAVNAILKKNIVYITSMIGNSNGHNIIEKSIYSNIQNCKNLGLDLADIMIKNGALDILKEINNISNPYEKIRPERI